MGTSLKNTSFSESITIAIPTYNEEGTLENIVNECVTFFGDKPLIDFEVLIVDDGSTDTSSVIARRLAESVSGVRLYRHSRNLGFSAVQRSAYKQASKDWVFILPADGQIHIGELGKFIPWCKDSDIILGTRTMRLESLSKVILSRLYYWLVQLIFGIPHSDYGACWMVRKRLCEAIEIKSKTPVAITEILVHSLMGGARVSEVRVFEYPRSVGRTKCSKTYLQIPRIFVELMLLYRRVHAPTHSYYQNPRRYQEEFMGKVLEKDLSAGTESKDVFNN